MNDTARTALRIVAGHDKTGARERFGALTFKAGEMVALVGPTGSGKTRLLADIERPGEGDSPTGRRVTLGGVPKTLVASGRAVARISQGMQFFLDASVRDFILMHAASRGVPARVAAEVLAWTNRLAGEPVDPDGPLAALSGGQARALMVADVVLVSDAPVLLIDEIENAGIDRHAALDFLVKKKRLAFVATHDPLIALRASRRLVFSRGGVVKVLTTSRSERALVQNLSRIDREIAALRDALRRGGRLGGVDG